MPRWLVRLSALAWRALVVGAVVYFGGQLLWAVRSVAIPLVLGLLLSAIFLPPVRALENRCVPRGVGAALCLVSTLAVVAGCLALAGFLAKSDIAALREGVADGWTELVSWLTGIVPGLDAGALDSESLAAEAQEFAEEHLQFFANSAMLLLNLLTGWAFATVFAFLFLKNGAELEEALLTPFRPETRERLRGYRAVAAERIGGFFRGVAVVAVFNATLTALAMWALGLPLIGTVALATLVGSFVPFAGPIIAGALAVLIALANGGFGTAAWMLSASLLIQALEGNLLQPFVVGRSVGLPASGVLIAIGVGTALAGVVGAFLAVPVGAAGVAMLHRWLATREEPGNGDPSAASA